MKKSKTPLPKIGKYLREVSVVVLGVAITLAVSIWISNKNEKRDLNLYLNAIKIELEENIKSIDEQMVFFEKQVEYANYLKLNGKKLLNLDTIVSKYGDNIWLIENPTCNRYAFEMFKTSGIMRLVNDKELLLNIWKAYTSLEGLEGNLSEGFKWKIEEIKQEMLDALQEKDFDTMPMYNFYSTPWPKNMLQDCQRVSELLKETVMKLEK